MLALLVIVIFVGSFVLYVSRNADVEGAQYDKALADHATGAVMIDDIDYTDPSRLD